ncbi:hypothetical protein [Rhodoferax sp.]|uniref:hypothetical protein n=1 Tax=Rhodoferax sp. TaxID=50421 RepID=UPI002845654B|nr:hypothetical protein [Rhodoferax sp.]MDR3370695.1 hypothetical protein [Rhodoferax sp.]
MTKKQTTEVVETNVRTVRTLDFTDADSAAAQDLGIMIGGAIGDRISRAVVSYNMAARLAVEAGYLLLSVKAETDDGKFIASVEAMGLTRQRSAELMRMAKFTTMLPEAQRAELLTLPKSKVLALASADSAVIEQMLEDGDVSDLEDMSVRGLRDRIRQLEAGVTDLAVERDTALADLKAAEKSAKRRARDEEDFGVPMVVVDARAELAALIKKAELAITSLYPVGVEIYNLTTHEEAREWVAPSLRLGLSGLLAVRELVDGSIKSYVEAMGESAQRLKSQPDVLAFLDPTEIKALAEEWARLTDTHKYESDLRVHERAAAKPRGKGRPANAPEAPTTTRSSK